VFKDSEIFYYMIVKKYYTIWIVKSSF
jgi:hypothetical protein